MNKKISKYITKRLCKKIAKLCGEHDAILKQMFLFPKETFIYARLNLGTQWIAFKIEVLRALIPRKEKVDE